MVKNWKKAKEVKQEQEEFPEPTPTEQYVKPIGPEQPKPKKPTHYKSAPAVNNEMEFPEPHATNQYSKPAGPKEQTPRAAQRPRSVGSGGGIGNVFAGVGQRITHVTQSLPAPTWLTDVGSKPVKGRKGKVSSSPASNIPDWVMTGRMPWEQTKPAQKQVAKIITTRVNADGTRTTTTRVPKQNKGAKRPNWINW